MDKNTAYDFLVKKRGLVYYSSSNSTDLKFMFGSIPKEYLDDKEFALKVIVGEWDSNGNLYHNPYIYAFLSENLRKDKDILKYVMLPPVYKRNRKGRFVTINKINYAKRYGIYDLFDYIPEEFKKDEKLCFKIWERGRKIKYENLPECLRFNQDVAFFYAKPYRSKKRIFYYPSYILGVEKILFENANFLKKFDEIDNFDYLKNFRINNEVYIKNTIKGLIYQSKQIKNLLTEKEKTKAIDNVLNDKDAIFSLLMAIGDKDWIIELSKIDINNKEYILKNLKKDVQIYKYLNDDLKNDKELIIELMKADMFSMWSLAPDNFKNDKKLIIKLIEGMSEYDVLRFIDLINDDFKKDNEIIGLLIKKNIYCFEKVLKYNENLADNEVFVNDMIKNHEKTATIDRYVKNLLSLRFKNLIGQGNVFDFFNYLNNKISLDKRLDIKKKEADIDKRGGKIKL